MLLPCSDFFSESMEEKFMFFKSFFKSCTNCLVRVGDFVGEDNEGRSDDSICRYV